jgi:glycosyltransferase involved in cell wall biosynthesis
MIFTDDLVRKNILFYQVVMGYMNNLRFDISVVIPTFNRVGLLERAIQSVLMQTLSPGQIIVVDDGSVDQTRETIQSKYKEEVIYFYQANQGVSHARNTGINIAKGNWIALLDSDDEWMPEKLEQQVLALVNQPDYGFCHTNEIWIRDGKRVNPMLKHAKSGGHIFDKCLPLCVISPSSVLLKKNIFDELGGFDTGLPACEDYDFWLKYCCQNPVLYIETPLLIKYGGHEDQLSKKHWGMDRFRLRSLLKLIALAPLSDSQKNMAVSTFYDKLQVLENGAKKKNNDEVRKSCDEMKLELESILTQDDNVGKE